MGIAKTTVTNDGTLYIKEIKKKETTSSKFSTGFIKPEKLETLMEEKLGKIATKELIKSVLVKVPEAIWWKVDQFLKKRYPGGGNGFQEASVEIKREST